MTYLALTSPRRRSASFRSCLGVIALALLSVIAQAAESRHFDIPAGEAVAALKQFAAQAGQQVIFPENAVVGIKTRALQATLPPVEALTRLLAGTGLTFVRDEQSGAFAIRAATTPPAAKPESLPNAPRVAPLMPDVTRNAKIDDTIIELSPFTVSTERDAGYQGRTTVAGNRINTNVTDFGASITVYTKEFLNDFGITNSTQLFNYAPNMEGGGVEGNYSGVDSGSSQATNNALREDPQSRSRARGLLGINYTKNSFITSIPLDSYNTGSVTVNRGPNAVIAGIGDPAGTVDTALISAGLRKDASRAEFRIGSEGSHRSVLDVNRVLVQERLALRMAGVIDDERYNQQPAFERKERIFGAVTFKPYKSTTVRGSVEAGRTDANRPLSILPLDGVSSWIDPVGQLKRLGVSDAAIAALPGSKAGRGIIDYRFYDDPARNPNAVAANFGNEVTGTTFPFLVASNQNASTQVHDGRIVFVYNNANAQTLSNSFRVVQNSGAGANQIRPTLFHPALNLDSANDGNPRYFVSLNVLNFPTTVLPIGTKAQGFTDFDAFDYRRSMIDTTSRQGESFHTFNVTLEQLFWRDRIGFEVSHNRERFARSNSNQGFNFSNNAYIRVDTTAFLPNGQPNPNVGRPLALFQIGNFQTVTTERESTRATGFLRYDFKELGQSLGRWLGDHTLTGLVEQNSRQALIVNNTLKHGPNAGGYTNSAYFNRSPVVAVYIGDSLLGANAMPKFNPTTIPPLTPAGFTANSTYFAANTVAQGNLVTETIPVVNVLNTASTDREVIKSRALVLQSNWLEKLLTTTVGWRRDEDYYAPGTYTYALAATGQPTTVTTVNGGTQASLETLTNLRFSDFNLPRTPPRRVTGEIKSYSAVLRWPKRLVALPRFVNDFGVFYNDSQNFSARAGSFYADRTPIAPPQGTTKEYGINLWTFDERLFFRLNRYETKLAGAHIAATATSTLIGNVLIQTLGMWRADNFGSNGGIVTPSGRDRTADIALLETALPPAIQTAWLYDRTVASASGGPFTQPAGLQDTSDLKAVGNEFEVEFQPTRQWRLMANASKQQTIQSNLLPYMRSLMSQVEPIITRLGDRPRAAYPATGSYQTLANFYATGVSLPIATALANEGAVSPEQRKWRANLVANYRFAQEGFLKGWSAGGALRWQDKIAIGYPISVLPSGATFVNVANPYFASGETNVDATLSYGRKVWSDRIDWRVQLNVRNLIAERGAIPVSAQPNGATAIARIPVEQRWYLTNSFSF